MALGKDFELLDDYLSNRMSGDERQAFEKKIEADPELTQELKIQQDLVEGIRTMRAAELKSMLNSIPVAPTQTASTTLLTKTATWVVITGAVLTGVYFIFNSDGTAEADDKTTPAVTEEPKDAKPSEGEPSTEQPEVVTEETEGNVDNVIAKQPAQPATKEAEVRKPDVEVYDPTKEETETETLQHEHDQLEIISKAFVTSSTEVETESENKKYSFHYMFKDGKLVLYGAFETHLYEILEFISGEKRTVVLFYKTNYYLLDVANSEPTALSPIRDKALLKKLKEYRHK
jgi:hypothetical protein